MKKTSSASGSKSKRWMVVGATLLAAALASLTLVTRDAAPAASAPAKSGLTRLQEEAAARFAGSEPYVTLPDGKRAPPANAAHALQMKVNAFQGILAQEAEERDPTFALKAEAELARRKPMLVAVHWDDVSGNREMDFTVEDSSACKLDGQTALSFAAKDVAAHPCLAQGGSFWEPDTQLKVELTPVSQEDPMWQELLRTTKKALATEAHLAQLEPSKEG